MGSPGIPSKLRNAFYDPLPEFVIPVRFRHGFSFGGQLQRADPGDGLLILRIGQMVNIGFDRPFVIGNAMVQNYCDVISTFVYRAGIKNAQFARATAIGLFQSVVGLIMITVANSITRHLSDEGGIW